MATSYTPQKFSIQQVFEILLRDPETKKITGYLDDCKTSGLENTATLVYPTGGRGNSYIGGAFAHSKRAKLNVSKATWNTNIVARQAGTTVVVGSNTDVVKYDVLTVASDKANTTFTALGTIGAEIGYIYTLNTDGTYATTLTQGAAVASNVFTYTPGTKLLTFNTGDIADGTQIALAYNFNSGTSAQTISIDTDKFASTQLVTAYGIVKDLCTGSLYQMQIDGIAQLDPNWKWDVGADKEPAVQDFNLEFTRGCNTKNLYDIIVYNEADAS